MMFQLTALLELLEVRVTEKQWRAGQEVVIDVESCLVPQHVDIQIACVIPISSRCLLSVKALYSTTREAEEYRVLVMQSSTHFIAANTKHLLGGRKGDG